MFFILICRFKNTASKKTAVLDLIFSTHQASVFYFRITTDDAVSLQRNV